MTPSLAALSAYIPSPNNRDLVIGPLTLHFYGLCIALGVIAAVIISSRRWEARGGNPDDIATLALWTVPAGVIGARIYHVATDWKTYRGNWGDAFRITQGGLGIPGGILAGVLVGLVVVRIKKLPAADLLDVVAPAIPVAQAIGRLGNWFNQELYGRPTTLPWGLKIDSPRPGYEQYTAFHPTFLYEALWNLMLAGVLVLIDRRKILRRGELFALYVLGYSIGRFFVEELRIDQASLVLGFRINTWTSSLSALGALGYLIWSRLRPEPTPVRSAAPDPASPADLQPEPEVAPVAAAVTVPTPEVAADGPAVEVPAVEVPPAGAPEPPRAASAGPDPTPEPVELSMVDHAEPGEGGSAAPRG